MIPYGLTLRQIGYGTAVVVFLILVTLWRVEARRADKWQGQAAKLTAELHRISTAKNEQAERTRTVIVEVEKQAKQSEGIAKRIEAAPVKDACKTPDAVMGADL